jgi:transposase
MPFRKISRDLKLAAVCLYEQDLLPLSDIIDCLKMSERTFYRVLNLWNNTGDVVQHTYGVRGRPRILHFDDVNYLKRLVKALPDWFLDELLSLLETNRFISVHYATIHHELVHANVSYKKLKKIALERNENLRSDFIQCMAQYLPEQLGFLDEVSKDERTSCRRRGRSRKGTRAVKKGVFIWGRCFSAEGLLTIDGIISNTVVKGSMN